ncbi:hypothetical protein [Oceaniovalibus guishaninsula]|uniref:hypothetical protein n=1 Tax=Oceaniovalibus guishaninsula TaxID=1046117 RepID=UPI0012EADD23|nr:hypothetical protein [Oceaniovalibus guishaninsula]
MKSLRLSGDCREIEVRDNRAAEIMANISPTFIQDLDTPSESISIPGLNPPSEDTQTAQSSNPVVFYKEHWHEYARYVQSFTRVWLRRAGDWQITTKFSNGHRTLEQHMHVLLSVMTKDDKYLFRARHEVDLAASGFGGANEYTSDTFATVSGKAASLAHDTYFAASGLTTKILKISMEQEPWLVVGD